MKKALFLVSALGVVAAAQAEPGSYVDLGTIFSTSAAYNTADLSINASLTGATINWYKFKIDESTAAAGKYLDIDLFATAASGAGAPDTEIGIYNSLGNMVANDDDDGHSLRSALTFGNTTSRTMPPDPFGFTNGVAANGRDGNLTAGTYWLAVGLFNTTFGSTNWTVTSNATGTGVAQVNFRTDAVPEPATMAVLGLGAAAMIRRRKKA